jgi:hypothetical protein
MDFGAQGALRTLSKLRELGPKTFWSGFGETLNASRAPAAFSIGRSKISILAAADPQFGSAQVLRPGVAPVGDWLFDAIRKAKSSSSIVGVSIHGGQEDIPIPSPTRQEFFRALVDHGADFVWGHHAHVPQVWEIYRDKLIAYGLGNFVVDPGKWSAEPHGLNSLVFRGELHSNQRLTWTVLGTAVVQHSRDSAAAAVVVPQSQGKVTHMRQMSQLLTNPSLHNAVWQEFAVELFRTYGSEYMGWLHPRPRSKRAIFRFVNLPTRNSAERPSAAVRFHMVRNHAHREMLETALGIQCGETPDSRTEESARWVDAWHAVALEDPVTTDTPPSSPGSAH